MMRSLLVFSLGVVLALADPALADEPVVTLRTAGQETSTPKYHYEAGQVSGLCPDILVAISKQDPGLQFRGLQAALSLPQIEHGLENDRFDVFCALAKLPRRERFLVFVDTPLYVIRHRVAVRQDDTVQVRDLAELARLSSASAKNLVIVTSGISFVDMLKSRGVRLDDGSSDNRTNLRKLIGGRGRFLYHNELVLSALIHEQHAEQRVKLLPAVFAEEALQMVASKQLDPAVLTRLGNAIRALKQSGELDRIYNRYF